LPKAALLGCAGIGITVAEPDAGIGVKTING